MFIHLQRNQFFISKVDVDIYIFRESVLKNFASGKYASQNGQEHRAEEKVNEIHQHDSAYAQNTVLAVAEWNARLHISVISGEKYHAQ